MNLIVGLGNPGEKYESTRHNLGKWTIKSFQKKAGLPDFEPNKKIKALISKKGKTILALPETFMNSSGQAVKSTARTYKIKTDKIVVVHDDFDLEVGKMKISKNRGSGGHKGIQSIIDHLKTQDFIRFRMGIKPKRKPKDLDKFVLKKFSKAEQTLIKKAINRTLKAISFYLDSDLEKTMNEFNKD